MILPTPTARSIHDRAPLGGDLRHGGIRLGMGGRFQGSAGPGAHQLPPKRLAVRPEQPASQKSADKPALGPAQLSFGAPAARHEPATRTPELSPLLLVELDFAFLADAADVSMGKLFVLGGAFDTIHVPAFPAGHPILAVVIRLLLSPMYLDQKHALEILLLDADAKHIASATGELMVPKVARISCQAGSAVILPLRFFNVPFKQEGYHGIEILADGKKMKHIPLRVIETPKQQIKRSLGLEKFGWAKDFIDAVAEIV